MLGNEATGLPDELAANLDGQISIPVEAPAESLNVGMAGTVIAFEAARQRRPRSPSASDQMRVVPSDRVPRPARRR